MKALRDLAVGDWVDRHLGHATMTLKITKVTEAVIACGPWTFDRATGAEIDNALGWGPAYGVSGSRITPASPGHAPGDEEAAATSDEQPGPRNWITSRPAGDLIPIDELIEEAFGSMANRWLDQPRRSLGGRTPRQALADGDEDPVRHEALRALLGDWS